MCGEIHLLSDYGVEFRYPGASADLEIASMRIDVCLLEEKRENRLSSTNAQFEYQHTLAEEIKKYQYKEN